MLRAASRAALRFLSASFSSNGIRLDLARLVEQVCGLHVVRALVEHRAQRGDRAVGVIQRAAVGTARASAMRSGCPVAAAASSASVASAACWRPPLLSASATSMNASAEVGSSLSAIVAERQRLLRDLGSRPSRPASTLRWARTGWYTAAAIADADERDRHGADDLELAAPRRLDQSAGSGECAAGEPSVHPPASSPKKATPGMNHTQSIAECNPKTSATSISADRGQSRFVGVVEPAPWRALGNAGKFERRDQPDRRQAKEHQQPDRRRGRTRPAGPSRGRERR